MKSMPSRWQTMRDELQRMVDLIRILEGFSSAELPAEALANYEAKAIELRELLSRYELT